MLSLPVALGLSNKVIRKSYYEYKTAGKSAYAFPDDGRKRIGICWRGDARHDNDQWRSMALTDMLALGELPNTQLYSLQIGTHRADLDTIGANGVVTDLNAYIRDIGDSATIIKELDYVVTVDTALAHIAGSVGAKVMLLIPRRGLDWRWLEGEGRVCWYPNTFMYRQKTVGDWPEVIRRVKDYLLSVNLEREENLPLLPLPLSEPDLEVRSDHPN
jgi:hypothetical protein